MCNISDWINLRLIACTINLLSLEGIVNMKYCAFEQWQTFTFYLLILDENLHNGFKHHTALELISISIIKLAIIFKNSCVLKNVVNKKKIIIHVWNCAFQLWKSADRFTAQIPCWFAYSYYFMLLYWWVWLSNIIWGQFLGLHNDFSKHNRPLPHWSLDS